MMFLLMGLVKPPAVRGEPLVPVLNPLMTKPKPNLNPLSMYVNRHTDYSCLRMSQLESMSCCGALLRVSVLRRG
jgi:hypothetical protein